MEISEIAIKNFKGIEEVKMGPIKPINVLIGRNNSGKSSVLACLQLLHKYFANPDFNNNARANPTIKVPNEYFQKDASKDGWFEISVTVEQTKKEREDQFKDVIDNWNKRNSSKIDLKKIAFQLDKGLFGNITFDFRGVRGDEFGLVSIKTAEKGISENIAVSPNQRPKDSLRTLALLSLFSESEFDDLVKLAKEYEGGMKGYKDGIIEINLTGGSLVEKVVPRRLYQGISGAEFINPAFRYVRNSFESVFMVSPYRHGNRQGNGERCQKLSEDGLNIVNRLHDLFLNNYKIFEEVAGFVKRIAPDIGRLHTRHTDSGRELELAYDWSDGRVVNLINMGGGMEQLLILGCILIAEKNVCALWEEPESHLHPGAQEILLNELEKRIGGGRVFMTTHSPVFVRSSDRVAVHIITNKDGKSGEGRTLLSDELREAASVLGSRPGHLVQADILVYVEGKLSAAVFEEWLTKWPKRDEVLGHLLLIFYDCNPDSMGTEDYDLSKLKKINPYIFVFVDKDNDPGSDQPKKSRRKLSTMCEEFGIPYKNTDKRQIEDYFTEEAVRRGLPTNIEKGWNYNNSKPMGEQLPTKKYNRAIAAAMKWEDVEKHKDIMQVFAKIEEYAKKLKPETNGG